MANYNQETVFNGLGTKSVGVPESAAYFIEGRLTLPTIQNGTDYTQVVLEVNINGGSAIYTGQPGDKGFYIKRNLTALDIINVVLSSSLVSDQQKNVVKMILVVGEL